MTSKACATNPALWHCQGRSSRFYDSPLSSHQLRCQQLATRSHADWRQQLPPIQQSPQQKAMTEARHILQQKRQTNPSYAALPAFFGLDEHTRAHLIDMRPSAWNNAGMERVVVMTGVSTSAVQVCSPCLASQLLSRTVLQMMSFDAYIQLESAAHIGKCNQVSHALYNAWHADSPITTSMLAQELKHLLPDLRLNIYTKPALVKALAADTRSIASRLLQLKSWFPSANVSMMVADRSHMLAVVEELFV